MDWISVGASTVSGALAGAVCYPLLGRQKDKRILYGISVALVFAATNALIGNLLVPPIRVWEGEKEMRKIPFYNYLAKNDPQIYAKIHANIVEAVRKKESNDVIKAHFAAISTEALSKYVARASDNSVNGFARLMVDEMDELDQTNPDLCYRFLFPAQSDALHLPLLSLSQQRNEQTLNAIAEVVHSAIQNPQTEPDIQKSQALMNSVSTSLASEFGNDLHLVQGSGDDKLQRHRVCQISSALYRHVLSLDSQDSSTVLRALLWKKNRPA
jgi:hypothetical protein